jgi:hypothetical protein
MQRDADERCTDSVRGFSHHRTERLTGGAERWGHRANGERGRSDGFNFQAVFNQYEDPSKWPAHPPAPRPESPSPSSITIPAAKIQFSGSETGEWGSRIRIHHTHDSIMVISGWQMGCIW